MIDPRSAVRARPCLVCETPCTTEGQLCPDCVAKGHRVTDDAVYVNLDFSPPVPNPAPASGV